MMNALLEYLVFVICMHTKIFVAKEYINMLTILLEYMDLDVYAGKSAFINKHMVWLPSYIYRFSVCTHSDTL